MAAGNRNRLSEDQLGSLATLLDAVAAAEAETTAWSGEVSIHFLRNYTTEFADPFLKFHLMRDGIRPEISHGGYDTMAQELLDPESAVRQHDPDVLVLSLLIEFLDPECANPGWSADKSIARIDELLDYAVERVRTPVVVNSLLAPVDRLVGDADTTHIDHEVSRINAHLRQRVEAHPSRIFLSDFAELFGRCGGPDAIDRRLWSSAQAPFDRRFLNEYAKDIAYFVRVLKGRARKCLVLDCDNTLWGGVIGEDGIDGIALHDREEPGVHFRAFQEAVVGLVDQGVMLALCSKNNLDDVWQVLDEHEHCLLDRSHLVAWRINWENKAANIASLADELNVGLDSFVFVDDSPQERALVAEMLPDVLVLGVPDDLSTYASLLAQERLFDTTARSDEDRKRTVMYQDAALRKEQRDRFSDLSDYLRSLETVLRVFPVDDDTKVRVAQLTQKTNQFNLTTRRYSVADIEAFMNDPDAAVYAMSVSDRYGDMGLTGVLIARRCDTAAVIDTLLLSCRVLGRQLEFAFVDLCLGALAGAWGSMTWRAEYLPTAKNAQVEDFWDRVGFVAEPEGGGGKRYSLDRRPSIPDYSRIISATME